MRNIIQHDQHQRELGKTRYLYGISALGSASDIDDVKRTTTTLLDYMSRSDFFSYKKLNDEFDENSLDYVHAPTNMSLENIVANRISFKKSQAFARKAMFFSFVPAVDQRTKKGFFYIQLEQPEVKYFDIDDLEVFVESSERDVLKDYASYENDPDAQMLLSKTYPMAFLKDTSKPTDGFVATFNGYSRQEKYMCLLANVILEKIIDLALIRIHTRTDASADVRNLLKLFVGACIDRSNLDDVAKGIASGIVDKLKEDYLTACERAWTKFELHQHIVSNVISILDPKSKSIFEKAKATDSDFLDFKQALIDALKKTIQDKQSALSEVYKQLLGAQNIEEANTEIASLNEQISNMETEKAELARARTDRLQKLSGEEARLKQDLIAKEQEIKALEVDIESKKSDAASIMKKGKLDKQRKEDEEKRNKQVMTTLAITGVIAGGVFWYIKGKKK